jgi:hypothetical protein
LHDVIPFVRLRPTATLREPLFFFADNQHYLSS